MCVCVYLCMYVCVFAEIMRVSLECRFPVLESLELAYLLTQSVFDG